MGDITTPLNLVSNTANLLKSTKTADLTIKTLTYSDVTDLSIASVNPNQQVGVLISYIKNTGGTCSFQAVGLTSGTVYWTSQTLGSTSVITIVETFTMTGLTAEGVKIQALSSETTNGVTIKGRGTSASTASCIMCGDIILSGSNFWNFNGAGLSDIASLQPISSNIMFEASTIKFASYYSLEIANTGSFPTSFQGLGTQNIDIGTAIVKTVTFPTNLLFNGISITMPLITNNATILGLFAISFTGFWVNY